MIAAAQLAWIAVLASTPTTIAARRGLFVEADLGGFVALGGRNTNNIGDANQMVGVCRVPAGKEAPFPKKVVSNLQAFVSLALGYDFFSSEIFVLAGAVRFYTGSVNGAKSIALLPK